MTVGSYNKLKSYTDERFIKNIIDRAHQEELRVIAWKDVGDKKLTIDLKIRTIRQQLNEIEFSCESFDSDDFNIIIANSEWVKIYIPTLAVLGQVKLLRRPKEGKIFVSYPEMVAQVDRRKHLRLNLEEEAALEVKCFFYKNFKTRFGEEEDVKTQYFEKYCHDISAGGLSFIASKQEVKLFKKQEEIITMFMAIDGMQINVDAKIVEKIQVQPDKMNKLIYKGTKICLKFLDLDSEDQKFIEDFVFKNIKISEAS